MAVIVKAKRKPRLSPEPSYARLHRVADRAAPKVAAAFVHALGRIRESVTDEDVIRALTGNWQAVLVHFDRITFVKAINPAELEPLTDQMLGVYVDAGTAMAGEAGLSAPQTAALLARFDVVNPFAVMWAQQHVATLVGGVVSQSKDAIRRIISDALQVGGAPRETASLIRHVIGLAPNQVSAIGNYRAGLVAAGVKPDRVEQLVARKAERSLRDRALTISRTETMTAANAGQQGLWEEMHRLGYLDPGARKVFIVTHDDRLCSRCAPYDGATVEVIGGRFQVGDGPTAEQPPLHPRCRCTTGLVDDLDSPLASPARAAPQIRFDDDEERGNYQIPDAIEQAGRQLATRLSPEDIANVSSYTGTSYRPINAALRRGDLSGLDDVQLEIIDSLDRTIVAAGELPEPLTVWRGISIPKPIGAYSDDDVIEAMHDYATANFTPGARVNLGGYQSTSMKVDPALDASLSHESPGIIFEIDAHSGANLSGVTRFDDEAEILLSRDTEYEVVSVLRDVPFYRESIDGDVYRTVVKVRQL